MPGDVGLVAQAVDTIFSWFVDENGMKEMLKRRHLKEKKEECRRDLLNNDFDALRIHSAELERLSNEA